MNKAISMFCTLLFSYKKSCEFTTVLSDMGYAGSKSRSPTKGDQSLLRRLYGQNWSPFSLLLP